MASVQPPRKKRKLSSNTNTFHSSHKQKGRHRKNTNLKTTKKVTNIDALLQRIENEPNEKIEMHSLHKIIQILKSEINKNPHNYSLYIKLSFAYLRSGKYEDALSYFKDILPTRDHPKFYSAKTLETIHKNQKNTNTNISEHNSDTDIDIDLKNAETNEDDSDIEICIKNKKKHKKKKKEKRRKKALKKLNKIESKHPRINPKNLKNVSNDSQLQTLENIPLKCEISIRVNLGLILCRICDFEDALKQCFICKDLYKSEFMNDKDSEYQTYDPYIDFIEMLIMYNQRYWYQSIEKANVILTHQRIKSLPNLKTKHCDLICKLDNHSLFELYCILADSHSNIGQISRADTIFEDIILKHITNNGHLQFGVRYHWIYEIYLRHLWHKKEWNKGYVLCMRLFANNVSYRYNESLLKLCKRFSVRYWFKSDDLNKCAYQFVIDSEHFGNQCRFVNHSSDIKQVNCVFTARYKYGNSLCPSAVQVWLKCTQKIEKGMELLVDYGETYWKNVESCVKLRKRQEWTEGFVFTHLVLDELESFVEMQRVIERHHLENEALGNKKYPNNIEVKKDRFGGFGAFATKTIKKDMFILRYAGVRRLCTGHDMSKSRYSIQIQSVMNDKV